MTTTPVIAAENLVKRYRQGIGKKSATAVDQVSFTIQPGEVFGFLGPNGSGKTTTIKMLCGLVVPTSGRVLINGVDVAKRRSEAVQTIGGVLEGNRNLYWRLSALENMEYYCGVRGIAFATVRESAFELLHLFDLLERKNDPVRHYSRGMQQRLALAVSLLTNPSILLLDEPTLGLDVDSTRIMIGQIRELAATRGITVFLTTHQMAVAQALCHRVAIMNQGRIIREDMLDGLLYGNPSSSIRVLFNMPDKGIQALPGLMPPTVQLRRENGHFLAESPETGSLEIYQLFQALQLAGAVLLDMRCQGNDLESVYLQVIQGEA